MKHIKYGLEKKIELQRENIRAQQQRQRNLICQTIDRIERFSSLPKKCQSKPVKANSTPDDIKRLQEKLIQRRQQVVLCSKSDTNAFRLVQISSDSDCNFLKRK